MTFFPTRHKTFEEIYELLCREIDKLVRARWLSADLAEDLKQELFLRLWKKPKTIEEIIYPRAWLRRVAKNLVRDHKKRAFTRHGTSPPEVMNAVESEVPSPLDRMVLCEEAQNDRDKLAIIREEIDDLPWRQRWCLELRHMGRTLAQIADTTGFSKKAVKAALQRGRERLFERLLPPDSA